MVKAVITNSAAGLDHPDDISLKIPLVSQVSQSGLPDPNMVGSHVYTKTNGMITADDWTVNGSTYRKNYIFDSSGVLSGKTDWVKVA